MNCMPTYVIMSLCHYALIRPYTPLYAFIRPYTPLYALIRPYTPEKYHVAIEK